MLSISLVLTIAVTIFVFLGGLPSRNDPDADAVLLGVVDEDTA